MRKLSLLMAIFIIVVFGYEGVFARELHVSKTGDDSASGSYDNPYLTINKAASLARPGDTVTIHAGTYREWVKPACGGTDENKHITYHAAPGEKVIIKGSERISSWISEAGGVWKVELPNSFFGQYNPYALNVSGGWLNYGQWHHRGDVYLNGEAFYEKQTPQEVAKARQSWSCRVGDEVTTIWANFGEVNPNKELTEINARESLFMPEITGLKYITVDGLNFMHAAANWAPPNLELQMGAVGPRMGKHWIIENCTITNARCVGIILGHAPGVDCGYDYRPDTNRRSQYYKPHTTKAIGRKSGTAQDDKWFNNFFIRQGLDKVKTATGYTSDYNVFLEGAKKSSFGDQNSLVDPYVTEFTIKDNPLGTTITFSVNDAPFRLKGPLIDADLVGVFPTVGQTIEDRYGRPIKVDKDFAGRNFSRTTAGPLTDLKQGLNTITWPIKQH